MKNTIIIHNPLNFQNEKYLKKHVIKDKYEAGMTVIIPKNEYPAAILIVFQDEKLCDDFISDYNGKNFEQSLN